MTRRYLWAAVVLALTLVPAVCRAAESTGCKLYVPVKSPEDVSAAAAAEAAGVVLFVDNLAEADAPARMKQVLMAGDNKRLRTWFAVSAVPAKPLPSLPNGCEGLAIIFPTPEGPSPKLDEMPRILELKKVGDRLAEAIRRIKKDLAPGQKLALATALSEIDAETTKKLYVPLRELIIDGTLDVVVLSGSQGLNLHRMRILRDNPLAAGVQIDIKLFKGPLPVPTRVAISLALVNETSDFTWLMLDELGSIAPALSELLQTGRWRQQARAAVDNGELVVDQEELPQPMKTTSEGATHHAQSFVASRTGLCPLLKLYGGPVPAESPLLVNKARGSLVPVEICLDDGGKPGAVHGKAALVMMGMSGYSASWCNAYVDTPMKLEKGVKYWIRIKMPAPVFFWRFIREGAAPDKHAWSQAKDLSKAAGCFRVYVYAKDK